VLGIKVLLRAGACRPREKLARSITSPPQPRPWPRLALCSLSPGENETSQNTTGSLGWL